MVTAGRLVSWLRNRSDGEPSLGSLSDASTGEILVAVLQVDGTVDARTDLSATDDAGLTLDKELSTKSLDVVLLGT